MLYKCRARGASYYVIPSVHYLPYCLTYQASIRHIEWIAISRPRDLQASVSILTRHMSVELTGSSLLYLKA
jgi:hypothetical protein